MRWRSLLLLLMLVALPLPLSAASPVKARSLGGSGLLVLRGDIGGSRPALVLHREPGMGRIGELAVDQLPAITPAVQPPDGSLALIVTAKKLDWYRIVYDSGERQGWLQGRRGDRYQRWEDLLPGRGVVLPAGLKKEFYQLRRVPEAEAESLHTLGREEVVTVVRVVGDWIEVRHNATLSGWLRWRDDNGRLLIAVNR